MVDANEFVKLQEGQTGEKDFKLATVTGLFETGTAQIMFFGEDEASEKEYSYLSSYRPEINDIVLVIPFADTYIIAGKVLFKAVIEGPVTMTQLNEVLENYVLHTALEDYALKTDLTQFIKDGDTIGRLIFTNTVTTSSLTTTGTVQIGNNSSNSFLGFFGGTTRQKQSVSNISASATPEEVRTALRNLITALNNYNLV